MSKVSWATKQQRDKTANNGVKAWVRRELLSLMRADIWLDRVDKVNQSYSLGTLLPCFATVCLQEMCQIIMYEEGLSALRAHQHLF